MLSLYLFTIGRLGLSEFFPFLALLVLLFMLFVLQFQIDLGIRNYSGSNTGKGGNENEGSRRFYWMMLSRFEANSCERGD
jgi:hypothetical protein